MAGEEERKPGGAPGSEGSRWRESAERFRALVENTADWIWEMDLQGRHTYSSPQLEEILGYTFEELSRLGLSDLLHPDDAPQVAARLPGLIAAKQGWANWVIRFRTKSGQYRSLESSSAPMFDESGALVGYRGVDRDITERLRVERELRDSEARYRSVVEDQDEFIVRWKPDGTRTFVNGAYARFFQTTREQLEGTNFFPLIAPDEQVAVRRRLAALTPEAPVSTGEHEVVAPGGVRAWQQWTDRAIFDEGGVLVELQSTGRIITERKRAEADAGRRLAFQTLLARISGDLLAAPDDHPAEALREATRRVADHFELGALGTWWFDADRTRVDRTIGWAGQGSRPGQPHIELRDVPWYAQQVLAGSTIRVADTSQLPSEASLEKKIAEELGVRAQVVLPLTVRGQQVGCAVASTYTAPRAWTARDVSELQFAMNIVAASEDRARTAAELRALKERLEDENVYLREEIAQAHDFGNIIGDSPALRKCLGAVAQVAPTSAAVLILGETGTGKELIARAIHERSKRSTERIVSVNCAALPANVIESELFGHEKGAFTGALQMRRGRFELADGGTLFLDEIGDLPVELQGKLLRVLQEGEFERVGGSKSLRVDVRVVAATNRDLQAAVGAGEFRADLYYRISTFPIRLPPLRERRQDVALLARHFVAKHARRLGSSVESVSARMLEHLAAQPWPGNVRELENVIERELILARGTILDLAPPEGAAAPSKNDLGPSTLEAVERAHIREVLERLDWVVEGAAGAASVLGVPPSTLRSRMKKLAIKRSA